MELSNANTYTEYVAVLPMSVFKKKKKQQIYKYIYIVIYSSSKFTHLINTSF